MSSGFPINPLYSYFTLIDHLGDTVSSRRFGKSTEYNSFYSVLKLNDSTFCFGGYCYDSNYKKYTLKMYFSSLLGGSLSFTQYVDPDSGAVYTSFLINTSDGGILATGSYVDSSGQQSDVSIIKLDSIGNFLWHRIFGGVKYDAGYSSIETPDKGFLTLGWTRSFGF